MITWGGSGESEPSAAPQQNQTAEDASQENGSAEEAVTGPEAPFEAAPNESIDGIAGETQASMEGEAGQPVFNAELFSADGLEGAFPVTESEPLALEEGEYLRVEGPPVYPGSGDFSASVWVRTNDTADGVALSSTEYGDVESYWSITKSWAGDFAVMAVRVNWGHGETCVAGSNAVSDGAWHHLVFVRDAGAGKIHGYLDGELELQFDDQSVAISDSSSDLTAGAANPLQHEWFVGDLGGIRTFQKALDNAEIRGMLASGPPG